MVNSAGKLACTDYYIIRIILQHERCCWAVIISANRPRLVYVCIEIWDTVT